MQNLQDYLTVNEAAHFLGVTGNTLRNWGKGSKITEYRHPVNNYRLYKKSDLKDLLKRIERSRHAKEGSK